MSKQKPGKKEKSFVKPSYESMKAELSSNFIKPSYAQDATMVSPIKPDLRGEGFYEYLNKDFSVSNEQINKLEKFISRIASMEMSGDHIHKSGSLGQRASKYAEDSLRLLLGGTENADKVIDVVNKVRGDETSEGDFNINDSSIDFLPDQYRNISQQDKALAILTKNFSEAIKRGLSEEQAYRIAASSYNKGVDKAIQDEEAGDQSYYSKTVSGG